MESLGLSLAWKLGLHPSTFAHLSNSSISLPAATSTMWQCPQLLQENWSYDCIPFYLHQWMDTFRPTVSSPAIGILPFLGYLSANHLACWMNWRLLVDYHCKLQVASKERNSKLKQLLLDAVGLLYDQVAGKRLTGTKLSGGMERGPSSLGQELLGGAVVTTYCNTPPCCWFYTNSLHLTI